ncbi:hypothetical protein [Rhodococcus koreensis]
MDDPPGLVAAWCQAKGRLRRYLADLGGPDAAQEMAYAAAASEHARVLRQSAAPPAEPTAA